MNELERVIAGDLAWCVITGDCLPVLADLPERGIHHVVTDPPYDAKTHAGARRQGKAGEGLSEKLEIRFPPIDPRHLAQALLRVADRWVLACCSLEQLGAYSEASGTAWVRSGVFHRKNPAPQFTGDRPGQSCEGIAIMHRDGKKQWNGGGSAAFWSHSVERERIHETQKPLNLMLDLIEKFTDLGDLVMDPFSGSGTTGAAAITLGRRYIGIEINPEHAERSRQRLVQVESRAMDEESARANLAEFFG